LDREWSTSALGPDQSGWDWFALQLDDGRELMFYRLRRKDGGMDPFSTGAPAGLNRVTFIFHSLLHELVDLEPPHLDRLVLADPGLLARHLDL
jgi:hypothetical protein